MRARFARKSFGDTYVGFVYKVAPEKSLRKYELLLALIEDQFQQAEINLENHCISDCLCPEFGSYESICDYLGSGKK